MTIGDPAVPPAALLRRAYAAYNRQDLDHLLTFVTDEVDWPDDGGGRLRGKAALRAYWTEQWTRTRTHDEPVGFTERDDGRIAVQIRQEVRSLDGRVLSTGRFRHLHRLDGDRIARLDIARDRDR
jgi:ketosteroid isomerase-like protein